MDPIISPDSSPLEGSTSQIPDDVFNQDPSSTKVRVGVIVSVVVGMLLLASVSYAMWQRSTLKDSTTVATSQEESTTPTSDSMLDPEQSDNVMTATRSATATPSVVRSTPTPVLTTKPTVTPTLKPTPTSTPTPTPTPVPVDVAITAVYLWEYDAMSSILNPTAFNTISIDERNWTNISSPISMTFELKTIGNTSQKSVPYKVSANGTVIQSGLIGLVNTSGTISQAFSLPTSPATYTVSIEINQPSAYTDANSSNNTYTFPYTIRPDTTPPQISFDILKRADTQQTCVTPRYATDTSTGENEIRFEGKLDSENWYSFPYRPDPSKEARYERCLTGPAGQYHTFYVKAWDKRGNQTEGVYSFSLYAF